METWQVAAVICCLVSSVMVCVLGAVLLFGLVDGSTVPANLPPIIRQTAISNQASMGNKPPEQIAALGPAVCPQAYGFYRCDDARFNDGNKFKPGVTEALNKKFGYNPNNKKSIGAQHMCCKMTNALGDERPWVKDKVKSAQNRFNILSSVFTLLLTLPLGIVAGLGLEVLATSFMNIGREAAGEQPMISCQAEKEWNALGKKQVIAHSFKNKEGKEVFGLYQINPGGAGHGCPIVVGPPAEVEYSHQVGLAMADLKQVESSIGVDWNKVDMLPFKDFVPSYVDASKPTIQCKANCERQRGGWCKCAKCNRYDELGECDSCARAKGDGTVVCRQEASSDLVGKPRCNGAGKRC